MDSIKKQCLFNFSGLVLIYMGFADTKIKFFFIESCLKCLNLKGDFKRGNSFSQFSHWMWLWETRLCKHWLGFTGLSVMYPSLPSPLGKRFLILFTISPELSILLGISRCYSVITIYEDKGLNFSGIPAVEPNSFWLTHQWKNYQETSLVKLEELVC